MQAGAQGMEAPDAGLRRPRWPTSTPWWARVVPFVASALFFVSALFLLFAPLPILVTFFGRGRKWAWLAALSNSALVLLIGGPTSLAVFFVFVIVLSLGLAELLGKKRTVERAVGITLLLMLGSAVGLLLAYGQIHHLNPWTGLRAEVSDVVKTVGQSVGNHEFQGMQPLLTGPELEEWKDSVTTELPSAIAVFALVLVWTNLVGLLRMNPGGLRERMGLDDTFFRRWRAPEYLVWPTIGAGFLLVFGSGISADIALNVFKFLMAIYAIQGLSILSFFFDMWNVRGLFRALGYLIGVVLMMPLLLSLGFFDLWFDFRAKFRQTL
jgi:uncharacterized protein YybS (DUF2232 family)